MSKDSQIPEVKPAKDPNEIREISILKRNLRLFKRMALGKKAPPMFLKMVCYIFLAWDSLMILYFSLAGVFSSVAGFVQSSADSITSKYLFTYALLHVVSLFGVLLIWRKKITGFYIFAIANILMPFWNFFIIQPEEFEFETSAFIFAIVAIALFAVNWRVYTVNANKRVVAKFAKTAAKKAADSEQ